MPEDYQGERHIDVAQCIPDRNGQKRVEFVEMPGPPPSLPPQAPRLARCLDVVFVGPYPLGQESEGKQAGPPAGRVDDGT